MTITRKRRHHYIWQYYLEAWASGGQVTCLRNGHLFTTGTTNLAVRTDYYRLRKPSPLELAFVKNVCLDSSQPFLKELNHGWFPGFLDPFRLMELVEQSEDDLPEIVATLEQRISNAEEDLHAAIEVRSITHLDLLREGDLTFLESPDERNAFLHFMCVQYFRTPKLRDSVVEAINIGPKLDVGNVWGLMSHIFATNVGFGLLQRFEQTRVTLTSAPDGVQFITSDQPVINLRAVGTKNHEPVEELELYYPVSPSLALRWDTEAGAAVRDTYQADADEVHVLNRSMLLMAQEQVFAADREVLEDFLDYDRWGAA